jgi:glycosyltransferase involved in cell wall biosynthesis
VKLKIGLLLANGFPVPAPFVLGLADLLTQILTGAGNSLLPPSRAIGAAGIINSQGFPVDTARNDVCRLFLETDADYLLFLDADMRHPGDLVHRLLAHDLPLVTGRYQMRKPPFHTVAMRKTGTGPHDYKAIEEQHGLVPIDAAGAGCLLIARDVLADLRQIFGDNWFQYQAGPDGLRTVSEDMWFFERAKEIGIQAYCDLDVVSTHVAQFEVDPSWQQNALRVRDAAAARVAGGA